MLLSVDDKYRKYFDQRLRSQKLFLDDFLKYFDRANLLKDSYNFSPNATYHSTSFKNHENYTQLYEDERNLTTQKVRELGWDIYAPYEKSAPGSVFKQFEIVTQTENGFTPEEIVDMDFARILNSEVILMDYNLSSNGCGQEAQAAYFIPKIIITRKRPTMLTGGLPGALCIYYDTTEQLVEILRDIFTRKSFEEEPFYVKDGQVYKGDLNLHDHLDSKLWKWVSKK